MQPTVTHRTIMPKAKYAASAALNPFFDVVQKGLSGLVDGEHYFDTVAEDAVFEFLYEFPGWPRTIKGRPNLMTQYAGYGDNIRLQAADKLVVHHAKAGGIVILEYQVQGTVLATGVPYNNRFVSVITIGDRKIIHWRDYMDSLAAWNALTGPKK
jgi:ketosteroid isomerase-like protein